MTDGLSREEAISFLQEELGITDAEGLMEMNQLEFLNKFCESFHNHSPFHNLGLLADALPDRHRPTWAEVKSKMITGIGGLCYTRNLFSYYLLKALGYTTKLVISCVRNPADPSYRIINHVITVILNVVIEGDRYLVENGVGAPSFKAIDVGFDEESPVFHQSHMAFKYVRSGDKIARMQQDRAKMITAPGEFRLSHDFTMEFFEPREIDHFFDRIYTDPSSLRFHEVIRCVKYTGNKVIAINNNLLLVEDEEHRLQETKLESPSAVIGAIKHHFPMIPTHVVERAVHNWTIGVKSPP